MSQLSETIGSFLLWKGGAKETFGLFEMVGPNEMVESFESVEPSQTVGSFEPVEPNETVGSSLLMGPNETVGTFELVGPNDPTVRFRTTDSNDSTISFEQTSSNNPTVLFGPSCHRLGLPSSLFAAVKIRATCRYDQNLLAYKRVLVSRICSRVQRSLIIQPALWASCSQDVLA